MKKIIISLALLFSVGNIMAQTPEEKAALKEAKKEAKTCLTEAQKIKDEMEPKVNDKSASNSEVIEKYSKGIDFVQKALNTKTIEEFIKKIKRGKSIGKSELGNNYWNESLHYFFKINNMTEEKLNYIKKELKISFP